MNVAVAKPMARPSTANVAVPTASRRPMRTGVTVTSIQSPCRPVPTKWTIQIGAPIPPPKPGDEDGTPRVAEDVRHAIDTMIADLLSQRRSILFG